MSALDTIATIALTALASLHSCREQAGVILVEPDGSYAVSATVQGEQDSFAIRVKLKQGEHLAAMFHTHPGCNGTHDSAWFSPQDIEVARALHVPSYILVATTGDVMSFTAGIDSVESLPHDLQLVRARGKFVSHIGDL